MCDKVAGEADTSDVSFILVISKKNQPPTGLI